MVSSDEIVPVEAQSWYSFFGNIYLPQPPTSLLKDISKLKHPNSRRTKALAKKAKRYNNRDKIKLGHAIKSNILGDKFAWFTDQLDDTEDRERLTPSEFADLFELYVVYVGLEAQFLCISFY